MYGSEFYLFLRVLLPPQAASTERHIHVWVGGGFNSTERAIFHVGDEILASAMAAAVLFLTSVEVGFCPISF